MLTTSDGAANDSGDENDFDKDPADMELGPVELLDNGENDIPPEVEELFFNEIIFPAIRFDREKKKAWNNRRYAERLADLKLNNQEFEEFPCDCNNCEAFELRQKLGRKSAGENVDFLSNNDSINNCSSITYS